MTSTLLLSLAIATASSQAEAAEGGPAPLSDDSTMALPAAGPVRAVSLRDALVYARQHQPSLQTALARIAVARAEASIPRAQWLPSAAATVQALEGTTNNSTASYINAPGVPLPRIGATPANTRDWSPSASTLAAVGATQEVFDFGRIGAQAAAADAAIAVEEQRARSESLRIDLVVKDAYFAVLGAKAVLRAAQDAFIRAKVHRDLAQAGVSSGLHAPIELTRAEADLTRFDVGRVRAAGALQNAQLVLAAAVGVPEAALDAAEAEVPAAPPPPPLPEVLGALESRDPVLVEAQARVKRQEATTKAIGALMRPDIALHGAVSGRAGGAAGTNGQSLDHAGWVPDVPNWDVGLVLRWPLYDGVISAQRNASAARENVARADLAASVQQEVAAVRNAYVALDVARVSLVSLNRAADAARANYAQADARFRAGLGTAVELADAEALRTDAEIQVAIGQFQVARTRAILARLIGE